LNKPTGPTQTRAASSEDNLTSDSARQLHNLSGALETDKAPEDGQNEALLACDCCGAFLGLYVREIGILYETYDPSETDPERLWLCPLCDPNLAKRYARHDCEVCRAFPDPEAFLTDRTGAVHRSPGCALGLNDESPNQDMAFVLVTVSLAPETVRSARREALRSQRQETTVSETTRTRAVVPSPVTPTDERLCADCGEVFVSSRNDARFCSPTCRTRSFRRSRKGGA
jgi:hypothetical protein